MSTMYDREFRRQTNEENRWLLGLIGGFWAVFIIVCLVLAIVVAGITIWWNYNIAPAVNNSERHAQTCTVSFMDAQKARIDLDLTSISNEDAMLTDPAYQDTTVQQGIKAQEKGHARDVYDALAKADCTRSQIISDMPELKDFFNRWPTRP